MKVTNLANTSFDEIFRCFKEAFTNYVVPMDFNQVTFYNRWKRTGVDWGLSFGAFDEGKLIAFMINSPLGKTLYNCGTGVIPAHRGKKLVHKLYDHMDKNVRGFENYSLEVIKENAKAFEIYKNLGFEITRELVSLKGNLELHEDVDHSLHYSKLELDYRMEQNTLRLATPSFESSRLALEKNENQFELHELKKDDELRAYVIYQPDTLSIKEIGAKNPIDKNLDQIFHAMDLYAKPLRVVSIENSSPLIDYFVSRGLIPFVSQYEMKKSLLN